MKQYTLGFVFDEKLERVLLMHKNRPDWQVGKINGLGGKIESGESSKECIAREVEEESGLKIAKEDWIYLGRLNARDWYVDVFTYIWTGSLSEAKTITDEQIEWFEVNNLPQNIIPNLGWIIPLVVDRIMHNDFNLISVEYN